MFLVIYMGNINFQSQNHIYCAENLLDTVPGKTF